MMRDLDPDEDDELRLLAESHGLPFITRIEKIDSSMATKIPSSLRRMIVPLGCEQGRPRLAIADPDDWETRDSAVFLFKMPSDSIEFVVCPGREIHRAIRMLY